MQRPVSFHEDTPVEKIRIQFTLFSAFYSPLISAMSGGFLKAEGLDPDWSVAPPGVSALEALKNSSAHVVQSALSQGFTSLNKGEAPSSFFQSNAGSALRPEPISTTLRDMPSLKQPMVQHLNTQVRTK